jgi:small subunit ribosomal protein S1
VGDDVDVKVLRVDQADRKIGLSMRNVDDPTVPDVIPDIPQELLDQEAAERERDRDGKKGRSDLRGGTGTVGPLFQLPGDKQ